MIDDWTPDNLPILLLEKNLFVAMNKSPIRIGFANVYSQDTDSLVAADKMFPQSYTPVFTKGGKSPFQSRFEVDDGTKWLNEIFDMPYQVSYYFPSTPRNASYGTGSYGAPYFSMRSLYEALCYKFNNGELFIEKYFATIFHERMGDRFDSAVAQMKQQVADEARKRIKQHKAYLSNYSIWAKPLTNRLVKDLASQTKKDIIQALSTGQLPLNKGSLSKRTLDKRRQLGISSDKVFYATGRLISSIKVSVILLDKRTASKEGQR